MIPFQGVVPDGVFQETKSRLAEWTRAVIVDQGFRVDFSAPSGGNRWTRQPCRRRMDRVRPDDILMLHDVRPKDPDQCHVWLSEVDRLLRGLKARGLRVVPLPELIGRPVMRRRGKDD